MLSLPWKRPVRLRFMLLQITQTFILTRCWLFAPYFDARLDSNLTLYHKKVRFFVRENASTLHIETVSGIWRNNILVRVRSERCTYYWTCWYSKIGAKQIINVSAFLVQIFGYMDYSKLNVSFNLVTQNKYKVLLLTCRNLQLLYIMMHL